MCYNIIVQNRTIAKGAVLEAIWSFKTAPFSIYDYNPGIQFQVPVYQAPVNQKNEKNQEIYEDDPASAIFSFAKARMEESQNTPDF